MNGYETAQLIRMRTQSEHTPIIFITAYAQRRGRRSPTAYASGAVDFIFAPIVPGHPAREGLGVRRPVPQVARPGAVARRRHAAQRSVPRQRGRARGRCSRTSPTASSRSARTGVIESFNRAADRALRLRGGTRRSDSRSRSMIAPQDGAASRRADRPRAARARAPAADRSRRSATARTARRSRSSSSSATCSSGRGRSHIGCLRDISERQTLHRDAAHQALHDDLTDLPNRVLFGDRVNNAIRAALRARRAARAAGDGPRRLQAGQRHARPPARRRSAEARRRAARRLPARRRHGCAPRRRRVRHPARSAAPISPAAADVAWKIQEALELAVRRRGAQRSTCEASIGIDAGPGARRQHRRPAPPRRSGDVRRQAIGQRVRHVRRRAGGRARAAAGAARRSAPLHRARRARFCTTSRRSTSGRDATVGVEALIRWNHPSGRLFMPDEFMPEVEGNELMVPITEWVINEALRTLAGLARRGLRPDDGRQHRRALPGARRRSLFETVDELIASWGIPPDRLTFELTESALHRHRRAGPPGTPRAAWTSGSRSTTSAPGTRRSSTSSACPSSSSRSTGRS